jgi:predicted metal-dependent hydrolase
MQGRKKGQAAHREEVIVLSGKAIPYKLVPRRAGWGDGFSISVGLSGVRVSASSHARPQDLDAFLHRHSGWLLKQVGRMEERLSRIPSRRFQDGETFPLEGRDCVIEHQPHAKVRPVVEYREGRLRFYASPSSTSDSLRQALEKWLKAYSAGRFDERVAYWSGRMGLKPAGWALRNQRTRWGSCSPAGVLYLNWRLILADPAVLDYIVVHEMAHLAHGNHGERFWKRVATHCPDYKVQKTWLKKHGDRLVF